jgi:nucleoside-diphosphate-sugar epimerase
MRKVMVLGGGGYVGSVLCPTMVERGYTTMAYDTFYFGFETLPREVWRVQGDIRDFDLLKRSLIGVDAVIHLACISNDPSFDLNPSLGESINWKCFPIICQLIKEAGVQRFIFASSSSVYGVKDGVVSEDVECSPLTDYSRFKLKCEEHLRNADMGDTKWTIIRPATVCGWSPRLRLDLVVNALAISAIVENQIKIFGGKQLRPNIHIKDMVKAYLTLLEAPVEKIHGQIFNAGSWNASLAELAGCVEESLGFPKVDNVYVDTNDNRSYHIDSTKFKEVLGFEPDFHVRQAVKELAIRWNNGDIDAPNESKYHNVKRMKELFPHESSVQLSQAKVRQH